MARVVITRPARDQLDALIDFHSLPANTKDRVRGSLRPLERFPELGRRINLGDAEARFILGPWPWLVVVYRHRAAADVVEVLAFEDARGAEAAPTRRV